MDKQERDLLRELVAEVYAIPVSAMIGALDHIDALEGQVRAAFYEGYGFGNFDGYRERHTSPDSKWIGSQAKAALTQAEEKANP